MYKAKIICSELAQNDKIRKLNRKFGLKKSNIDHLINNQFLTFNNKAEIKLNKRPLLFWLNSFFTLSIVYVLGGLLSLALFSQQGTVTNNFIILILAVLFYLAFNYFKNNIFNPIRIIIHIEKNG